jgi:NADH:ubiquinone oxidoreductase subunit F (NADH-binding)
VLIDELRKIQHRHGFLPPAELEALSERERIPMYEIHGVASFYPHFRFAPRERKEVRVCTDLSCHLRGASALCARLKENRKLDVEAVSCLGRCDHPVAVAVDGEIFDGISDVKEIASGKPPKPSKADARVFRMDPYGGEARYEAAKAFASAAQLIDKLKMSGLRGMGGAGFPAGIKWETVANAASDAKYVICNADESEPGTFKDRALLGAAPHLVLEGMILGGRCVGAREGIVYLRHEYARERKALDRAIRDARARGLLGGTFDVRVFDSPGGYICGEETALLEALEGKRAEPRNKPPFPATHGLWQKPTLINNVETFAAVPFIAIKGGEAWKKLGVHDAAGLKLFAVSGDVARPGVYEVPLGTTIADLLSAAGGAAGTLKAIMPGGASSGFLPASMTALPLDFKPLAAAGSMLGSGALVAVNDARCILDLALNVVTFFRNESCGKCVPCREGTERLVRILEEARSGRGKAEDTDLIEEVAEAMAQGSICGLGQAAPLPILLAIRHFKEEVLAHFAGKCPAGVCRQAGSNTCVRTR